MLSADVDPTGQVLSVLALFLAPLRVGEPVSGQMPRRRHLLQLVLPAKQTTALVVKSRWFVARCSGSQVGLGQACDLDHLRQRPWERGSRSPTERAFGECSRDPSCSSMGGGGGFRWVIASAPQRRLWAG